MPGSLPDSKNDELAELLAAVQAEAPGSWERFVERYERLVWSVPRRMGFSDADSADIAQATWLLVWRHVKHVRHPKALASWLITTTSREAARFGKRDRRREEQEGLSEPPDPSEQPLLPAEEAARLEEVQLVRDAIGALDSRCSKLLTETDLRGAGYKEAAATVGMPVGSVGPTRLRCLTKLMDVLALMGLS
jgi:RNA polymerase sigma factor (sigma-70 family)